MLISATPRVYATKQPLVFLSVLYTVYTLVGRIIVGVELQNQPGIQTLIIAFKLKCQLHGFQFGDFSLCS